MFNDLYFVADLGNEAPNYEIDFELETSEGWNIELDYIDDYSTIDVKDGCIRIPQSLWAHENVREYTEDYFENEVELLQTLKDIQSCFSIEDYMSRSLEDCMDVANYSPFTLYEELGHDDKAFMEAVDFNIDNFKGIYPFLDDYAFEHPIEVVLSSAENIEDGLGRLVEKTEKFMDFKNKYERDIIMNSPNGNDLFSVKDSVSITKELEDLTHITSCYTMEQTEPWLWWTIDAYKENPLQFFAITRDDNVVEACEVESSMELPDTDLCEYHGDIYTRLKDMFNEQYHFVPKVLPQLECGLAYLYGAEISDETLKNFVDNFNRKSVAMVKDTYNPSLITLAAMGKIQPGMITREQREILTAYTDTREIKNLYKIAAVLNQTAKDAKLEDYINVIKNPDIASEYLKSINGMHDVTFKEISQEINNKWMEREKERFENKYGYSFESNKVQIEGAEKVIEMNGLKAYILPADDLRNFTVGYDTDCCQHFGGAGETCVVAATTRPNAGIFVIEKNDKIEAQAFVWTTGHENKDGKFVFDSIAFDNIEFANDQNLNKHGLVMRAYDEGISQNEYRAIKKTMDYEGILAAYVKELPYENVYMGTGYNEMGSIGVAFNKKANAFEADKLVEDAIGSQTYTDFDEHARILKFNGEMCMEPQKDMEIIDGRAISSGRDTEYTVASRELEFALAYEDIWENASNNGYGSPALDLKDKAEQAVCDFMERHGLPDPEQAENFEDAINDCCDTYNIVFDSEGRIIDHAPIENELEAAENSLDAVLEECDDLANVNNEFLDVTASKDDLEL